jgi:hypothetical protein
MMEKTETDLVPINHLAAGEVKEPSEPNLSVLRDN